MASPTFDLLVVGGGINGAGVARDAAMRGLSVLLVEAEDWGSGTSSKSSMLAHGGLRYLEQFELGLVHEALQERERMFAQAPHLVRPLEFVYPLYPHIASRRTVRFGLFLYDLLSHGKSLPKRDYHDRASLLRKLPGLRPDGLIGGATYHDGQWQSVERFVAELVISAGRHGAHCLNHTRVERLCFEEGRCTGAVLRPDPAVPGAAEAAAEAMGPLTEDGLVRVEAAATVNAAGPWVDDVLDASEPKVHHLIRKTKGIHIVVPQFVDDALIIRAQDGRTFFIIPWQRHCVIGTTDTDYDQDPREVQATAEEVQYLQESVRLYFPEAPVDDVRFTYAGVRPLVNEEGLTESHVTRRHVLHDHAGDGVLGLWSVQGGKLTTYRSLAEEAVDAVCRHIGAKALAKRRPTRSGTLPGGPLVPWATYREQAVDTARTEFGLGEASARHLVETYGARWRHVLQRGKADGLRRIHEPHPHLMCEIDHAVQDEQARTVADFMLRRSHLGLGTTAPRTARVVAARMGELLGWSRGRRDKMLAAYEDALAVFAVPR